LPTSAIHSWNVRSWPVVMPDLLSTAAEPARHRPSEIPAERGRQRVLVLILILPRLDPPALPTRFPPTWLQRGRPPRVPPAASGPVVLCRGLEYASMREAPKTAREIRQDR